MVDSKASWCYNVYYNVNIQEYNMSRVSETEIDRAVDTVRHMSLEELAILQDEISLRRNALSRQSMREIHVGSNVQFKGRGGQTYSGNVIKKAIKYVTVDTGMGRWKVPASMLTVV